MHITCNNTLQNTQIQPMYQRIADATVTSVKPTITIECLPLTVWENMATACGINALLTFRLISKTIYYDTLSITVNSLCKIKNFNNYVAFSIENYFKFIKPKFSESSPILINSIDEYISLNYGRDNFQKTFPKFLFFKMHSLEKNIRKSFATTIPISLHDKETDFLCPSSIKFFVLSSCGNFCIMVNQLNTVILFDVTSEFNLKQLTNLELATGNSYIKSIFFTAKNNLCIINVNTINGHCRSKLTLYKLETQKLELIKLAELVNDTYFKQAVINANETRLVLLTCKQFSDTSTDLEIWELYQNQFIKKAVLHKSQILQPNLTHLRKGIKEHNIEQIVANTDVNILALSVRFLEDGKDVCFLTVNEEEPIFRQEYIVGSSYHWDSGAEKNLQLNSAGNFCISKNEDENYLTVLTRKNHTWYTIFKIDNGSYYNVKLMPYENSLLVDRQFFGIKGYRYELIIMPFSKKNTDKTTIRNEFYQTFFLQQDKFDGDNVNLYLHPTGLAVFKFRPYKQYIEIIAINKSSILDTIKSITNDIIYSLEFSHSIIKKYLGHWAD